MTNSYYRWNLKSHFELQQVYNVQIIKRIQISNTMLRNSVQRYVMYVDSSMSVSKADKHINIMWIG